MDCQKLTSMSNEWNDISDADEPMEVEHDENEVAEEAEMEVEEERHGETGENQYEGMEDENQE